MVSVFTWSEKRLFSDYYCLKWRKLENIDTKKGEGHSALHALVAPYKVFFFDLPSPSILYITLKKELMELVAISKRWFGSEYCHFSMPIQSLKVRLLLWNQTILQPLVYFLKFKYFLVLTVAISEMGKTRSPWRE